MILLYCNGYVTNRLSFCTYGVYFLFSSHIVRMLATVVHSAVDVNIVSMWPGGGTSTLTYMPACYTLLILIRDNLTQ